MLLFGLLPLLAHTILVFFMDCCCHFNLRLTNSLMIIHECLIGAGIIIAIINFNMNHNKLTLGVESLAKECLIDATECQFLR